MNINRHPDPSNPFEALDFEETDFDVARRALDEPPPGLEQLRNFDPGYWVKRRRDICAADKALTGETIDWLIHLPPSIRPQELCQSFPRLANLIAEAWADRHTVLAELNNLIGDGRGGRRGFPPRVRDELCSLREILGGDPHRE